MFTHMQVSFYAALIVGYFAAHAAGLMTKAHAPKWMLGIVTVFLSALAGVLSTVAWNPGDTWQHYLVNVIAALVMATLGHKSTVPEAIRQATPTTGVG